MNTEEVSQAIRKILPRYLCPNYFMQVSEFPLTANGKIDKEALLNLYNCREDITAEEYLPRSKTEKIISRFFCEILELKKVNIYSSFFDIGGNSLMATKLISSINAYFNITLEISSIFSNQSINELAKHTIYVRIKCCKDGNHEPIIADLNDQEIEYVYDMIATQRMDEENVKS